MANTARKRVVGVVIGSCDKCSDTLPVIKRHNMWLCDLCNAEYERSLASPAMVEAHEKDKTLFHELFD